MKNELIIVFCGILLLNLLTGKAFSQLPDAEARVFFSLPEVALVDIEPGSDNSIRFTVNSATEAGGSPFVSLPSNNVLWINYSSSFSGSSNSRNIVAEITQGVIPEGIQIFLQASNYSGSAGRGRLGTPAGKVQLVNQPRPIITGIGNCFTGNGINNGHRLTFSIAVSDYSKVRSADESNFVVLYTVTDI